MFLCRILQDLDMNDNRITSLEYPQDSSDAVAKRWVNQQLKDGMKVIDELDSVCKQIQMTIRQMQTEYDPSIKELTKKMMTVEDGKVDKSERVSTNGGAPPAKLPLPQEDGEPVSKISFSILKDEISKIKESTDALRTYV